MDQEGTAARVLNAIVRAAQLRVQQGVQVVRLQNGEPHTLLRSLVEDLAVALGVAPSIVRDAAAYGVEIGSLTAIYDDERQITAVRAQPF